jgi:hypothetical protein
VFTEFPSAVETMKEGEEVTMRISKTFLSVAVMAAGGLLVATVAMAQVAPPTPAPTSCETPNFSAVVTAGPTVVPCVESTTGQCTEISYAVSGSGFKSTDHVFAFEGLGTAYVKDESGNVCSPSPCNIFPECVGDNLDDVGAYACHEQVSRVNANATKSTSFTVGLAGQRNASATSVVIKKGKITDACRILGIGGGTVANPLATTTPDLEEVLGGKCKVHVQTDPQTGVVTVKAVTGCTSVEGPFPIGSIKIQVGTDQSEPVPVELSEGFNFILGTGSCTYKQYYPTTGPVYKICY